MSLLKPLYGVLHARISFNAEIHSSKMTFTELLKNLVLLTESIAVSVSRIIEHETSFVKDRYFIGVLELSTLIPANDSFVNKSAIARKVLYDSNSLSVLILIKN